MNFLHGEDREFLVLLALVIIIAWMPFNSLMGLRGMISLTAGVVMAQGMYVYLTWRRGGPPR